MRGHVLRRLRGHAYADRLPVASLLGCSEERSAGRVGKSWLLSALEHEFTQDGGQTGRIPSLHNHLLVTKEETVN